MQQPSSTDQYNNQDHQDHIPTLQPQMQNRQSNISMGSQMSFNGQSKKQKSKSFSRKQNTSLQDNYSMLKIYRQMQFAPQVRNILKKMCYLDKQKIYKFSVGELKVACQKQLKRIQLFKKTNNQIQRFLDAQNLQQTDNELSIITITCQIRSLVEARNQPLINGNSSSYSKNMSRQYQNLLLEIQKSDELIRNFINTNLKLPQPNDLNIAQCKKFFKRQASQMSLSSDRVILSRKTLCEIIIFLCRLLQGQILAFDDVYQYQQQTILNQYQQTQNGTKVYNNKNIKNRQVKIRNLDQSFSDSNQVQSSRGYDNKKNSKHQQWNDYSSRDLGLKVNQLAGICQQIPQLQSFTRTLKFSKITLQNRQSFFKIVDVIISLHHKIGYLSRNKPTLMRQIQSIQTELTEIYESIRSFIDNLLSQIPTFKNISFKKQSNEDTKHQMSQTLSSLKKDLHRLADIIESKEKSQVFLYQKIALIRTIISSFHQSLSEGDENLWQQFLKSISRKQLDEQQSQIIHQLGQCFGIIQTQIKNNQRQQSQLQTQRNLQAQVHTLVTDYERIRAQNQQLQAKVNVLIDEKQQMIIDIEQRDKMIANLTSLKISAQKRQRALRDELIKAQQDCRQFQHVIDDLQRQLERMSIQNENYHKDLIYKHQDENEQLIAKITELQRAKMQLLQKYENQCMKSIQNLHGSNNVNLQLQSLKQRLDKKTKQNDDNLKKFKELINNLEKQTQELKNDKQILQGKLEFAEKNKNKLMEKLQQTNNKFSQHQKSYEQKYLSEFETIKQNSLRLQKQLEKYKRNNSLLNDQIQHLKAQLASQSKLINQYRQKLTQYSTLQASYETLQRQFTHLEENYQKLQNNNQTLKSKCSELSTKQNDYIQKLDRQNQYNKKLEKKKKDLETQLQQTIHIYQNLDLQFKQQQKINKAIQKKIPDLEAEIQSLQELLKSKDKNHSSLLNKSELRLQELEDHLREQNVRLGQKLKQLQKQKQKNQQNILVLQRKIRELTTDAKNKEQDLQRLKKDYERKINDKQSLLKQAQQDLYNINILIKQLKQQKQSLQQRLSQAESAQRQKDELRKSIYTMELNQQKLNDKISKLEDEVQRLYQEIQKLKQKMRQKQREMQQNQQKFQEKQRQLQQQNKNKQNLTKNQQIIQIRQQLINQKTIIVQENNKLHQENNSLHEEIDKLKKLNEMLQKNIKKQEENLRESSNQNQIKFNEFKQIISKYTINISGLQSQLNNIRTQNQSLKRLNQQIKQKFQQKCKLLAQKQNLLFQKDLVKNNLQKFNKQLKYKIQDLQNTIQSLNQTLQKLKNNKIKSLQAEIDGLNGEILEYRKKEEVNRQNQSQLEGQIQRLKKQNLKKLQNAKSEKTEISEYYENLIKKTQNQHVIQINDTQKRVRKQTQNEFNQLLIKQKQTFNNLSISKMQQLGQMQRKYQKLIKEERIQKSNLQEEINDLTRQLNQLKKYQSLNSSKLLIQEAQNTSAQQQLAKLKSQFQSLRRQFNRLQQQNQRLQRQLSQSKQQNSSLTSKNMELDHNISLLNTKITQLTINLESSKKSLEGMLNLQRQKINVERQLQKLKNKTNSDQVKINDYKNHIEELEKRIAQLDAKIASFRGKQFEWSNNNIEWNQKNRNFTIQINQLQQKLAGYERQIFNKDQKIKQRQNQLNAIQQQWNKRQKNWQQKQRNYKQIQNKLSIFMLKFQNETSQSSQRQILLKQQNDKLNRKLKQMEVELQNGRKVGQQSHKLTVQYMSLQKNYQALQEKYNKLEGEHTHFNLINQNLQKQKQALRSQLQKLIRQGDIIYTQKQRLFQENSKLNFLINELNNKISVMNSQIHAITIKSNQYQNQLMALNNISKKSTEVEEQMKKLRQYYEKQMKNLAVKLKQQFQSQKLIIVREFEQVLAPLNSKLEGKNNTINQLNDKINKLLADKEEAQKMLDKLRKQNMQLSDHCKKYEQKIQILQSEHKAKGSINIQMESKYQSSQNQKSRLQQDRSRLQQDKNRLENDKNRLLEDKNKLQQELNRLEQDKLKLQQINIKLQQDRNKLQQERFKIQQDRNRLDQDNKNLFAQLQRLKHELRLIQDKLTGTESQRNRVQYERKNFQNTLVMKDSKINQLISDIQNLKRRIFQLQTIIQNLQNQRKMNQHEKQSQQNLQNQRLKTELAITRQQILRLHGVIKKKEQDFQRQIVRLTKQKGDLFAQNQNILHEHQNIKIRISQFQVSIQNKQKQAQNLRNQNSYLMKQIQRMRSQLLTKDKQLSRLNQSLLQLQRKQQQLIRSLTHFESQNRKYHLELQSYKGMVNNISQQGQEFKLSQSRLKQHNGRLEDEIVRLKNQIAIVKMEYERLYGQYNKMNQKLQSVNQQNTRINLDLGKQKAESERLYYESNTKDQTIIHLKSQLERLSIEINSKWTSSNNIKGDLDRANIQISNLKGKVFNLQRENQELKQQLTIKQKNIQQLNQKLVQASQSIKKADVQLKRLYEQRQNMTRALNQSNQQKQYIISQLKSRQSQILTLKNTIQILQQRVRQLQQKQKRRHQQQNQLQVNQSLNQSRSSVNLVTKSYSYQGGQATIAQINRLQEQIKRLIKQIQNRDKTITQYKYETQSLQKQIKVLKEQIQLLSEGKTINIKGYTRITNPNDTNLNTKGVLYTEYDLKEFKAKIQLLQKAVSRYQNRQTELIKQIEKYKFRERAYLDQIKALQQSTKNNSQNLPGLISMSPTKKTSFDEGFSKDNYPSSSTYRLQTGIQVTQVKINMNKKDKYFLRIQGQELRKIIQRISNSNMIISSKIDEILQNSRKTNRQSLQQLLTNNIYHIPTNYINQIRDINHQNKALIQTLRSLKQDREDVDLLIQEYIDPQLLTQFVYRILTYFSQVQDDSEQSKLIRTQLNQIRKNNVGGYYFTVLQQYTKYILQHNSIEVYKQQLRQKAKQLINFKQKFQTLIDSKLDQNDKLLKKSDSRGSLLSRSRSKYTSGSRIKYQDTGSRVKYQYSESGRQEFTKNKEHSSLSNSGIHNTITSATILTNPTNNYLNNLTIPTMITVNGPQRNRTSSHITYTPYNQQIFTTQKVQTTIPTTFTQTRTKVIYSNYDRTNQNTNVVGSIVSNSSNINSNVNSSNNYILAGSNVTRTSMNVINDEKK